MAFMSPITTVHEETLSTPAWLKRSTPSGFTRPLTGLSTGQANRRLEPAETPAWLKRAASLQKQQVSDYSDASTSETASESLTRNRVVVLSKGDQYVGAVKARGADVASLRAPMQTELKAQLKQLFPRGWLFALPGNFPIWRQQEMGWLVQEIASRVDSDGQLHVSLVDDCSPPPRLQERICALALEALRGMRAFQKRVAMCRMAACGRGGVRLRLRPDTPTASSTRDSSSPPAELDESRDGARL
jgi:uncharacterized protein (DUF1778 family)